MDTAFEHEIRQRAYEIWVATGMIEGEAEFHWLHAERAVRSEADAAIVSTEADARKAKPAKAAAGATRTPATKKNAVSKAAEAKTAKAKTAKAEPAATKAAASRRPQAGAIEAVV